MIHTTTQFQIEQLRAKNMYKTMEALFILVAALFVSALLPSLMVRYVYANQQLFEEPLALQIVPLVAFVIGIGEAIFVLVTNFRREMKANRMEAELVRGETTPAARTSTKDLQVALSRIDATASKSRSVKASSVKATKAKKTTTRRK
jgi:hypothetical protein